jgi:hypothetical protein
MEHLTKEIFGAAAVVLAIVNYLPYLIGSLTGKSTPHVFTWSLWFLLTSVAFFAQFTSGGGIGSWATGITAFIILLIAISSLRSGFDIFVHLTGLLSWVRWERFWFGLSLTTLFGQSYLLVSSIRFAFYQRSEKATPDPPENPQVRLFSLYSSTPVQSLLSRNIQ